MRSARMTTNAAPQFITAIETEECVEAKSSAQSIQLVLPRHCSCRGKGQSRCGI